jgi:hypothetical protein
MAWLALARTGDVHVRRRRLKGVLPWLVALAGAVGAVMLVFQVLNGQDIPGRAQGFVPSQDAFGLIWGSGMALVVPAGRRLHCPAGLASLSLRGG